MAVSESFIHFHHVLDVSRGLGQRSCKWSVGAVMVETSALVFGAGTGSPFNKTTNVRLGCGAKCDPIYKAGRLNGERGSQSGCEERLSTSLLVGPSHVSVFWLGQRDSLSVCRGTQTRVPLPRSIKL